VNLLNENIDVDVLLKDLSELRKTPQIQNLLKKLNYQFNDDELLFRSLCHKSFSNEKGQDLKSNERLEFLGDAVLQSIISTKLFNSHTDIPE